MTKIKRFRSGGSSVASAASDDEPKRYTKQKTKFTRAPETASAGGNYPVKPNTAKVGTESGNNIIKRPSSEVAVRAGKSGIDVGKSIGKAARLAGRAFPIITGALEPSELGDSSLSNEASAQAVKGGAFKQGSKSDSIVDAINAEPKKTSVSAPASKKESPVAVVKKSSTTVMKPKGPTEGDRARAALKEFKAWNDSRAPLDSDSTTAEDMNTQGKIEAVEGMKKGGMTKRPPKPAKKVPPRKFASGGSVSRTSASKRGDGCATKGHTKGKYL